MEYKLSIVGTPIGNLEDITLRAINTLKASEIILCEDTRVTYKLLKHLNIENKKLITYNNFNELEISEYVIKLILEGKHVSLVSDAGMPCISDPGFEVIKAAKKENIFIDVVGGPTALIHALVKANQASKFTFLGFLKDKSISRQNELKNLNYGTYVCYVSPHKLLATLNDFEQVFKDKVDIYLIKEMTKMFETSYEGKPLEVIQQLGENIKGEFSMVFTINEDKKKKVNKYAEFSKHDN
ncbi:16S rRNA (cytidine(1402)-2'-O)-methyltransferase [[Mycoplasma] falconis]|uniref:Ribosomal RNA small subunit methyltransferase I n=1 Tax=[Mycoplasma] falconis TaxID=92403 RepID=A0A501XA01_9BACT|nr:16S rRNA (cytidine(1402)-2'-O)-methyltransferase [[Mycoplasma] falconis]TPE57213.1 16S rRNA (cytidine(1402)-2'-O)-methyltransferase [[Mycoplasma] falconis]